MLKTGLLFVLLIGLSNAKIIVNCSNSSDSLLTFERNTDVDGRYTVKWCTKSNNTAKSWAFTLRYNVNRTEEMCQGNDIMYILDPVHSKFEWNLNADLNCTNVCLSRDLDLIFNGTCYQINTSLKTDGLPPLSSSNYVFYIKNPFPMKQFTKSMTRVSMKSNNEYLTAHWFLSYVPATDYTIKLCNSKGELQYCDDVTSNCSTVGSRQNEVWCSLAVPYGSYVMWLLHRAPWTGGILFSGNIRSKLFEHKPNPKLDAVASNANTLWVSCSALAAALVLAIVLALACRRLRRNQVWLEWVQRSVPKRNSVQRCLLRGRVLLLYARDCERVMRLADALRTLLRHVTDDKVYDLYSEDTWAEVARAPNEWVRRALTSPDVRVVLLQTPALAELHRCAGDLKLERPLLGRRALYRLPHAADDLVSLALRLLNETAHMQAHSYLKCYKTTVSGLEVDVIPTVTPLRCYRLPLDALALLRDLDPALFPAEEAPPSPNSAPAPSPSLVRDVQALQDASDALLSYVRDNPAYLTDELLVIGQ